MKIKYGLNHQMIRLDQEKSKGVKYNIIYSRTSNIAFLSDLDFGLIRQNIPIKKASFHYQGCPLSLKSGKL